MKIVADNKNCLAKVIIRLVNLNILLNFTFLVLVSQKYKKYWILTNHLANLDIIIV